MPIAMRWLNPNLRWLILLPFVSYTLGITGCAPDQLPPHDPPLKTASREASESDPWIWFQEISGSGEEAHAHFMIETSDGGFVQVGETGLIPSSARVLIVKIDAHGNLAWQQELGVPGHNLGNAVLEVADGYWVVGALNHDSLVLKLDKGTGEILIERTHDFGGSDGLEHLIADGEGFLAAGYRQARDRNGTFFLEGQGLVAKFDSQGQLVQSIDVGARLAQAYRLSAYGGDYFVSGLTFDAADYGLMRLGPDLKEKWFKSLGGPAPDHNFAFAQHSDGSLYLSGHTLSGVENWDTYTIGLNEDGEIMWQQTRGNPRGFDPKYIHDEVWDMVIDDQGLVYIIAGTGDEYAYSACNAMGCSDTWRVYLLIYDAHGALVSEQTFGRDDLGDWAGEALAPSGPALAARIVFA